MATNSSILAWRIPVDRGAWRATVRGIAKSQTSLGSAAHPIGEGNGTPLQCSCLENPMGGGAWWAAVHGVAEGRTRLSDFPFLHWRRTWQPTPVFLPGESQGRGCLVGCSPWGRTESDTNEPPKAGVARPGRPLWRRRLLPPPAPRRRSPLSLSVAVQEPPQAALECPSPTGHRHNLGDFSDGASGKEPD